MPLHNHAHDRHPADPDPRVRLFRCPHGTFHLSIAGVTLHLTELELTRIGQAISVWAQQHPEWVLQMAEHNWPS